MRPVDFELLRDDGVLVLLTVEEVMDGTPVKMADFKDTHAMFYFPLRAWMGMSSRGVELGSGQPELIGGVWYVARNDAICSAHENLQTKAEDIVLRPVE